MESANIHHHHHHHHQHVVAFSSSSSSSLSPPNCCYGVGSTTTAHTCRSTPTTSILNANGYNIISYPNPESNLRPGEQSPQHSIQLTSLYMAPNSGFHLGANTTGLSLTTTNHSSPQDFQLSRIQEVFSDHYDHLKYTELLGSTLNPSSLTHHEFSLMSSQQTNLQSDDIRANFLLKPFSSGNLTNKIDQLSPGDLSFTSRTGFSQIFPGANLSDFNQQTNPAGSPDMNLQAVDDLLSYSRFSGNFSPASYGLDHVHQPYQTPLHSSNKMSSDGAAEAKRSSCSKLMEAKALQTAPKKSRVEARASCPPFKVRKEKVGDRIAALQQLVAPFGKTDTASVLMEAIGYIKFLQTQVETLMSLSYMKNTSTNIHTNTTTIIKAEAGGADENESEEAKRDLRSRGLCLVPLSCITDGGAVLWPPPPT